MAIIPLQDAPIAPHIPLGQKIHDLNSAADQSILTRQTIQANKLKLADAQRQSQDELGLNAVVKAGGTDEEMLAKAMGISSSAYAQLRDSLAKAHTSEQAQIKAKTDAQKSFYDLIGERLQAVQSEPEENRPLLWAHVVRSLKKSGIPEAANLSEQYDPATVGQYTDAKAKLDAFSKTLDNSIKIGKDARDAAESLQKITSGALSDKKTQSEIDNASLTPDLKEFNDTKYFQTFLRNHKIDPMSLNPTTEAQYRGEAFTEFKRAQSTPANPTQASLAAAAAKGDKDAQKALDIMQSAADEGTSITPESLDMVATNFAKTGTLPPLGMGKSSSADRRKILNRAAELYPNVDLATNKADYDANKQSERTLQTNRDQVVAFENTAGKNLDNFLNASKSVYDSGSPWVNTPLRAVNQQGLGSGDLAAFNAARQVAINEIAKVTSNPGLTGQLSDAARKEVEAFIPANATMKQIYAVAAILKSDMKNRHDSLDEQLKAIRERIKAKPGQSGNTATVKMKAPNGQTSDVPADQVEHYKSKGAVVAQ